MALHPTTSNHRKTLHTVVIKVLKNILLGFKGFLVDTEEIKKVLLIQGRMNS